MKFTLKEKIPQASDVTSFIWEPEQSIEIKAGQYMHYVLEHENPDSRGTERWFTNSAAPFEGHIAITTRFFGDKASSFKKALFKFEVGETIEADTPEGDFTVEDVNQKYVFISGGIGITPFRSILVQLHHEKKNPDVTLLYANKNEEFVFLPELVDLEDELKNLRIHKFISPKYINMDDIKELVPDISVPTYYVSGPKPMVFAFRDILQNVGIAEDKIKLDDFPGYSEI